MCLIVFAFKNHPEYDLIFAANRDEFYERPTREAQFWDDYPQLLAGKDLKSGGTWLGINRRGEFSALTNYRDPSIQREDPPSRGQIVLDFLTQKTNSKSFLKKLHQQSQAFMGFNVLAGSPDQLYHYSNQEKKVNRVEPGLHGLSNHLLNTPWPKVERAKSRLKQILSADEVNEEALFDLLQDDTEASADALPETGIPDELEKKVSPIFIKTDTYGTRSSTLLLIDKDGTVTFEERRYVPGTASVDQAKRYEFEISKS